MTHDLNGPTRRDEPIRAPRHWFGPLPDDETGAPDGWRDRTLGPIPAPPPGRPIREGGGPLLAAAALLCGIGALACIAAALWLGATLPAITECPL